MPDNNLIAMYGDSRIAALDGGTVPTAVKLNMRGPGPWLMKGVGYRAEFGNADGAYGVSGNTTTQMLARVAAVVASAADTIILLGGVNDTTQSATSITNLEAILDALDGKGMVVLLNELPAELYYGTPGTTQNYQLARVAWLSDPQRAIDHPNVVQIDSFNYMLKGGTGCSLRDGNSDDGLHLNLTGVRDFWNWVGEQIASKYAAYPVRAVLPTGSGDTYDASTNPTGAILPDFMMTGDVSGIATGWAVNLTNTGGATIDVSKGVGDDGFDEQIIHIYGSTTAGQKNITLENLESLATHMNKLNGGDKICGVARVIVDAGASGLRGLNMKITTGGSGPSESLSYETLYADNTVTVGVVTKVDEIVRTPVHTVNASWAVMTARSLRTAFQINFLGASTVDFTLRISRCALKKLPV